MYGQVLVSSLRNGEYVLRAFCTEQEVCKSRWEVNLDEVIGTLGDMTLAELRQQIRCPQCDAPITTTLVSLK